MQENRRTQTVLAIHLGAFIYALMLTIMQNACLLADEDMTVAYLFSVGVIVLIVILRWMARPDKLGSVEETARRVEERAIMCIDAQNRTSFLGERRFENPPSGSPRTPVSCMAGDARP